MRKTIAFLLALCLTAPLWAQARIPLLDRMAGHRVTCHYVYSLSRDEEPFKEITSGTLVAEGNAFRLDGLGMEMYSNGTSRWSVDPEGKEVVVEKVGENDLLANPAHILASYRQYMHRIRVLSSSKNALTFTFRLDEDAVARIALSQVVFSDEGGMADFTLDEKALSKEGYVITDLR